MRSPILGRLFTYSIWPPTSSENRLGWAYYQKASIGTGYPQFNNVSVVAAFKTGITPSTTWASLHDGCSPLPSPFSQFAGQYVMVSETSGTCTLGVKASNVANTGAIGVLYVRCPFPTCNERVPTNSISTTDPAITVPVSTIRYLDAVAMINTMMQNTTVYLSFPGSGPMNFSDPDTVAEYEALKDIGRSTSTIQTSFPGFKTVWDLARMNTTYDPCWPGDVFGVNCINGHIREYSIQSRVGQISGTLLPSFKNLKWLQKLFVISNSMTGVFPSMIGMDMRKLVLFQSSFTSFADLDWNSLTNLEHIEVLSAGMKGHFPDVSQLTKISYVDILNNKFTNMPNIYSSLPVLKYFDVHNNLIKGPCFNFSGASKLLYLDLSYNNLTGNTKSNFDQLTQVGGIDLSFNQFDGPLPTFSGVTQLIELSVSTNNFSDSVGCRWNSMPLLVNFFARSNRLNDPICLSSFAPVLETLDLGSNRLTGGSNLTLQDPFSPFLLLFPSTIVSMNLSDNRINIPILYGTTWKLRFTAMTTLLMNNNKIPMIAKDLVEANWKWKIIDFSYNQIQSTVWNSATGPSLVAADRMIPEWGLGPTIILLKLDHNLFYNANARTTPLPGFAKKTSTFIVENDKYFCPSLVSSTSETTVVTLDASYYEYSLCNCQRGYFGKPPNCTDIPTFKEFKEGGIVSDSIYGNNRLMPGINTKFVLKNYGSFKPMVSIVLDLNLQNFKRFTDSLDIYQGDQSLNGEKIFSVKGDEMMLNKFSPSDLVTSLSTSKYGISIMKDQATIVFNTLEYSGQFFTANFSFMSSCPPGYVQFIDQSNCYKLFQYSNPIQIVVFSFSAVSFLIVSVVTYIIYVKRTSLIVKSASAPFCFLILLFLMNMAIGSIWFAFSPENKAMCHLRPWFTTISLIGVLSALLVKADRIRKIFNSTELVVQAITNAQLYRSMGLMLLCQLAILVGFTSAPIMEGMLTKGSGAASGLVLYTCQAESSKETAWIIIQFLYICLFLVAGIAEAWGVRKVPTAFNEGPHIASCLLSLTMLLIILVPLNFLVNDNPDALMIIRGVGQNLICLTLTFFLFGPKLFYILEGRENDKHLSSIGSKNSSTSSSQSSSSSISK